MLTSHVHVTREITDDFAQPQNKHRECARDRLYTVHILCYIAIYSGQSEKQASFPLACVILVRAALGCLPQASLDTSAQLHTQRTECRHWATVRL